ncbi:MAG: hypothetical protein A2040_00800 [Rhodocyclales bacterium GWA2_65_19]|nr:MAG: hypothetical protein A2040_00800 [Rhodocyclales bacterium GWA2_65_19]
MEAISSSIASSADAEQRKIEKLFAWVLIAVGVGTSISGLFDSGSGLFTRWDDIWVPITSSLYFVSGVMIYLRSKWLTAAILLSAIPTGIYEQGVMFVAVHHPDAASYYSASSSGPMFPLLYMVLFIALPRGAATWSWINCAGFYLQFLLNSTLLSEPLPTQGRVNAEHVLVLVMAAHPVYILSLNYIVKLRERLHTTQQEAFKNKEDFLAMLSHEIRNLLQTMVGAIELLDLKLKGPPERRSVVRLQKAATQLQTYLTDINELTMLEDPALRIQITEFDLAKLLDDVRDEWLPKAQRQGLQLAVHVRGREGDRPLLVRTDETRLRQIISNLASNALKYTEVGSVTIAASACAESSGSVMVEVVDTGIGIDEKYLTRIFQPYVRLENAKQCKAKGSGLGLAIVQRLVASIGGSVQVESTLNRGTAFRITLPGLVER